MKFIEPTFSIHGGKTSKSTGPGRYTPYYNSILFKNKGPDPRRLKRILHACSVLSDIYFLKRWNRKLLGIVLVCALAGIYFYLTSDLSLKVSYMLSRKTGLTTQDFWAFGKEPEVACHIPELDPFDPSIEEYFTVTETLDCGLQHPKIFTVDEHGYLIQVEDPRSHGYVSCCYRKFARGTSEFDVEKSRSCVVINNETTKIPSMSTLEFVEIKCMSINGNTDTTDQKIVDIFGVVPLKQVKERWDYKEPSDRRRVNVVILGLDAVSRLNFLRTFKASHYYLKNDLSTIDMKGYTKHADNTFPNILPVLSGLSEEDLIAMKWNSKTRFDNVPLIWKNFSKEGYRTSFAEDAIHVSIFQHEKRGFRNPPTDYYYHPLTRYMADQIGHTTKRGVASLCYGPRLAFEVLLDLMKKTAVTMDRDKRYFQFTWATSLTHDRLNMGRFGDQPLAESLKWLNEEGYLNDTVFILMSDHGIRAGDIRSTLQGKIEERMPLLYFVLPQWFREKYHHAVANLKKNERRLTSHFDLHETLVDLLYLDNIEDFDLWQRQKALESARESPRGISLFLPVPLGRTCEDAGISSHWCVCRELKSVSLAGNEIVIAAAKKALETINLLLSKYPKCSKLLFHSVLNAQVYQTQNTEFSDESESESLLQLDDPRLTEQTVTYNLIFKVTPSGGTFEATVTHHTNGEWEVSPEMSRTNVYGTQSRCIHDYNLKKYCYCG